VITHDILVLWSLLAAAPGGPDRGELSLAPRQETRTKIFRDGRSIVAYNQNGTMVGGSAGGPWRIATLFAQGTIFKDAGGRVVADVALWETTDPDGDLVWGVVWRPGDAPHSFEIKTGTGKWKGIAGRGKLLDGNSRWVIDWSIANLESAALRCKPGDYAYHDSGFSFHGPHVTEMSRKLPNGATLVYNNQSGVLLSDTREARSPRNLATSYDRGTTYSIGDRNLADIMLLEDTDPDGDTVWLYHEWWYGTGPGSYEFIGGTGKWKGISGYGKTLGVLRDRVDDHWLLKSEMHWNMTGTRSTDQKWVELIESKRAELGEWIYKIFKIVVATEEDTMMASLLLWDDGSIEIHYRDYRPEDTSLRARSAVRIYHAISRSREDHKKVSTEEYVRRMMGGHAPDPDKIIDETIRAILKKEE
jgi:hypothetical protein